MLSELLGGNLDTLLTYEFDLDASGRDTRLAINLNVLGPRKPKSSYIYSYTSFGGFDTIRLYTYSGSVGYPRITEKHYYTNQRLDSIIHVPHWVYGTNYLKVRERFVYDGNKMIGSTYEQLSAPSNWNQTFFLNRYKHDNNGKIIEKQVFDYDTAAGTMSFLYAEQYVKSNSFSVKEKEVIEATISIYPNPAKEYLKLDISIQEDRPLEYSIANMTGVTIEKGKLLQNTIDINKLRPGSYFLELKNYKDRVSRTRFVKVD